jgi:DNA-binding NtrC family response regulator
MNRVLVVDDEVKLLRLIAMLFEEHGYSVQTATQAEDAEELLSRKVFDLLITDVRLPRRSGIDLMRAAHSAQPDMAVIVMTAYATVSGAVDAMRLGAFHYLQKPFELDALLLLGETALEARRLRSDNAYLRSQERSAQPGRRLVAESPAMESILQQVKKVADTPSSVLILGESGVGKELVAETLHNLSARRGRPLVRVNCPAIPRDLIESELFGHAKGAFTGASAPRKGKFEIADGGTLFLDEIGDLPLEQQGKLLHVLENFSFSRVGSAAEIAVDVRILAATNRDLAAAVEQGAFRSDLFYRLNVFPIHLPPLRDRPEDIPGLTDELLQKLALQLGRPVLRVSEEVVGVLAGHSWPGNVRELRNVLERAAVLTGGDLIGVQDLPAELTAPGCPACREAPSTTSLNEAVEEFKVRSIVATLRACGWKKKDAAARLGLSPRALSHYIQRHDIERFRGARLEEEDRDPLHED